MKIVEFVTEPAVVLRDPNPVFWSRATGSTDRPHEHRPLTIPFPGRLAWEGRQR